MLELLHFPVLHFPSTGESKTGLNITKQGKAKRQAGKKVLRNMRKGPSRSPLVGLKTERHEQGGILGSPGGWQMVGAAMGMGK